MYCFLPEEALPDFAFFLLFTSWMQLSHKVFLPVVIVIVGLMVYSVRV
jgi:hypothetical protein